MSPRWTPSWARFVWICALAGAAIVFSRATGPDEIAKWTSILGFFVALIGLLVSVTPHTPPSPSPGLALLLDQAAEDLAAAVGQQWRAEEKLRRLQDPFPLPVHWTTADAMVTDHWDNIVKQSNGLSVNFAGRLADIADVFNRVPSRRLVVIGKPGAGKSILMLRFTLDYLERRQHGDRVPVIFQLATWHPEHQALDEWMSSRLAADYQALGARAPSGATWAWELIHADRVVPVLDGLDEIPESLRCQAMRQLNSALGSTSPAVLACRAEEYRATVNAVDVFTAAAVVELQPLNLDDLAGYLPQTTRQVRRRSDGRPTTKWEPVLAYMRDDPDQPLARALLEVLSIPLMTSLARAAYSETDGIPSRLLDARFTSPGLLEEHLLDAFIPAVYAYHPTAPGAPSASAWVRYRPDQAREWLRLLACHMSELGTQDLAWWQIVDAVPRLTRGLRVCQVNGVTYVPVI